MEFFALTNECEKLNRPLNFRRVPKEQIKDREEDKRHGAENVVKCLPAKNLRLAELASQWHRQNRGEL